MGDGHKDSSLVAAELAHGGKVVVNVLCCIGKFVEFPKLSGEGGEFMVTADGDRVFAFVEVVRELVREVRDELLSEGAGPGSDGVFR